MHCGPPDVVKGVRKCVQRPRYDVKGDGAGLGIMNPESVHHDKMRMAAYTSLAPVRLLAVCSSVA